MGRFSRGPRIFYGVVYGATLVFSVALLSTHSVFMQMIDERGVRVPAGQMWTTNCTLVDGSVEQQQQSKYMARWNTRLPPPNNVLYFSAIASPLAFRTTYSSALRDLRAWPANFSFPCRCPPLVQSAASPFERACSLDTQVTDYLEQEAFRYQYAEATLLGIGVCLLIFGTAGLFVLLWDTECFWACCNTCRRKIGLMDFHVMDDDSPQANRHEFQAPL